MGFWTYLIRKLAVCSKSLVGQAIAGKVGNNALEGRANDTAASDSKRINTSRYRVPDALFCKRLLHR